MVISREPTAMEEIHTIQERIYEETKHMTPEERARAMNEKARAVAEEYGLIIVRTALNGVPRSA